MGYGRLVLSAKLALVLAFHGRPLSGRIVPVSAGIETAGTEDMGVKKTRDSKESRPKSRGVRSGGPGLASPRDKRFRRPLSETASRACWADRRADSPFVRFLKSAPSAEWAGAD